MASIGFFCPFPLACSEGSQLPCCELPYEVHVARNQWFWPTASEDLRSANSHKSELGLPR